MALCRVLHLHCQSWSQGRALRQRGWSGHPAFLAGGPAKLYGKGHGHIILLEGGSAHSQEKLFILSPGSTVNSPLGPDRPGFESELCRKVLLAQILAMVYDPMQFPLFLCSVIL